MCPQNADPGKMDDDNDITHEPDDMDTYMMNKETNQDSDNLTRPKTPASDTLQALGAGKKYKQPSY